jgi:pyruvate ferredoxin oxidoreductase alpha subunit
MVCVDGFILTHAYEQVDIPEQNEVDEFLPEYNPHIFLEPKKPLAIGTMVSPTDFMEVRYLAHQRQKDALKVIDQIGLEFSAKFKRNSGGLIRQYNVENADTVVVAMGSVLGTIKDTVDELNMTKDGKFGVLSIVSYRPFPEQAIRDALKNAKRVIVLEKAFALGKGGILSEEVEMALKGSNVEVKSVIAGVGGKIITKEMLKECFLDPSKEECFLGLNQDVVQREYRPLLNDAQ